MRVPNVEPEKYSSNDEQSHQRDCSRRLSVIRDAPPRLRSLEPAGNLFVRHAETLTIGTTDFLK